MKISNIKTSVDNLAVPSSVLKEIKKRHSVVKSNLRKLKAKNFFSSKKKCDTNIDDFFKSNKTDIAYIDVMNAYYSEIKSHDAIKKLWDNIGITMQSLDKAYYAKILECCYLLEKNKNFIPLLLNDKEKEELKNTLQTNKEEYEKIDENDSYMKSDKEESKIKSVKQQKQKCGSYQYNDTKGGQQLYKKNYELLIATAIITYLNKHYQTVIKKKEIIEERSKIEQNVLIALQDDTKRANEQIKKLREFCVSIRSIINQNPEQSEQIIKNGQSLKTLHDSIDLTINTLARNSKDLSHLLKYQPKNAEDTSANTIILQKSAKVINSWIQASSDTTKPLDDNFKNAILKEIRNLETITFKNESKKNLSVKDVVSVKTKLRETTQKINKMYDKFTSQQRELQKAIDELKKSETSKEKFKRVAKKLLYGIGIIIGIKK